MTSPKSMTGLMDATIKGLGCTKAHKASHTGAYELKTASTVAELVQAQYPERELKALKVLFYSRRAVISAKIEKDEAEAAAQVAQAA